MKRLHLIAAIVTAFVFVLNAQGEKTYAIEPGYVNFGDLSSFEKGEDVSEVIVEQNLLKMISKMTENEDPELSKLLKEVKLVMVNSFKVKDNLTKELKTRLEGIDKQLSDKNWNRIVKVRGAKEYTNVYLKPTTDGNAFDGLVVITLGESGQVSLVNIVGKIDLESIGRLGDKFDIPALDKADKK